MNGHIVKSFEDELEALSTRIAEMGGLTEAQLAAAVEAVAKHDTGLAERTVQEDRRIDAMEHDIHNQAIRLIALRQPMAADLRETIAAFRIASDLERIGDLAKNMSKRALAIWPDYDMPTRLIQGMTRMGQLALAQLNKVLDAYANRDAAAAHAVWQSDEQIDEMYNSVFRELLTYMMEDPRTISSCTHLLFMAKNLERIGDHATNIAETVRYLITGEQIVDERPKGDKTSIMQIHSEDR